MSVATAVIHFRQQRPAVELIIAIAVLQSVKTLGIRGRDVQTVVSVKNPPAMLERIINPLESGYTSGVIQCHAGNTTGIESNDQPSPIIKGHADP